MAGRQPVLAELQSHKQKQSLCLVMCQSDSLALSCRQLCNGCLCKQQADSKLVAVRAISIWMTWPIWVWYCAQSASRPFSHVNLRSDRLTLSCVGPLLMCKQQAGLKLFLIYAKQQRLLCSNPGVLGKLLIFDCVRFYGCPHVWHP